mgnify:CR=1 FL=1
MKMTAKDIYDKLIATGIYSFQGNISFDFGGININVCQKDVVGNIIQEWLQKWFENNNIDYTPNKNSQMPPDFFLDPDDLTHNMLEVKAFNYENAPGFDIADFKMYAKEIQERPYMLDIDYLIFGYSMDSTGSVTIKEVWLKKVWEITRRGDDYPLSLQVKNKQIHKIRPAIWYHDKQKVDFTTFSSLDDFISAIDETLHQARDQMGDINTTKWLSILKKKYKSFTGIDLNIRRWDEIKDQYNAKAERKKAKLTAERDNALKRVNDAKEMVKKYKKELSNVQSPNQQAQKRLSTAQASLEKAQKKFKKVQRELKKLN